MHSLRIRMGVFLIGCAYLVIMHGLWYIYKNDLCLFSGLENGYAGICRIYCAQIFGSGSFLAGERNAKADL